MLSEVIVVPSSNLFETTQDRPLITFALFAYNQEEYIQAAVEGALSQTYGPLEIIVSDDCSSDKTFEVIKQVVGSYTGPHTLILNRNQKNLGIGKHVSVVTKLAKGALYVFAAGDDISDRDRVAVLVDEWLRKKRPSAICSQARVISASGKIVSEKYLAFSGCDQTNKADKLAILRDVVALDNYTPLGAAAAYSPELFERFGPLSPRVVNEDNILGLRAWITGSIAFVHTPLVSYRRHDRNAFNQVTPSKSSRKQIEESEDRFTQGQEAQLAKIYQYQLDLKTSLTLGFISSTELECLTKICLRRAQVFLMLRAWYSMSFKERCRAIVKQFKGKNYVWVRWALVRLLGKNIYIELRYLRVNFGL